MILDQGDIKFYQAADGADVSLEGSALLRDPGFETSVLISLLSNARAGDDDVLPDSIVTAGGYWASDLIGVEVGSKLWLLGRSNITTKTLSLAKSYCNDALQWMIDDGIASTINTVVTKSTAANTVDIAITIERPSGTNVFFAFYFNWIAQKAGGF